MVSCCFCFPSKRMRLGYVLHQHGRVAQVQTMLTVGLIFIYLLIPCASRSQDPSSEERFHVELHFSPGVKGCEEDRNVPTGFGFRPASAEVSTLPGHRLPCLLGMWRVWARRQPCCSARLCCRPVSSSNFFADLSLVLVGC